MQDSNNGEISIKNSQQKNVSFEHSRKYFQFLKDQFPSVLLSRFEGLPREVQSDRPINRINKDWKFWFLLFMLSFLAVIKYAYPKDFDELKLTFRNWGINQQTIRELGLGVAFGTVLLNIFSVLSISFYLFQIIDHYQIIAVKPDWMLMAFTSTTIMIAFFIRYSLLKISEFVFPFRKEVSLYNYYELQINRVLGVLLFPFAIVIAFGFSQLVNPVVYTSILVIISMLIIRYIKGFKIGFAYFGGYVLHFLLYICALEIVPILIVIRLLLNIEPIRFPI